MKVYFSIKVKMLLFIISIPAYGMFYEFIIEPSLGFFISALPVVTKKIILVFFLLPIYFSGIAAIRYYVNLSSKPVRPNRKLD